MKNNKLLLLIILISIIGTIFVYNYLPDKIPQHWNIKGEVDRWGDRNSVFITALIPIALYLLLILVPKIDPKRNSYSKHKKAYSIFRVLIILFLIGIHWATILYSLGYKVNIKIITLTSIGILFIVLGNYMSQIRHNYMFGIRTPWTLANEEVWRKTHRLGGFIFICLGILSITVSLLDTIYGFTIFFASVILSVIWLFIYSYLQYKKIKL